MALWSGRFEEGVSEFTQEFGASLPVDKAMCKQDIAGSMARTICGMTAQGRPVTLYAVASRSQEKADAFAKAYGIPRAYGSYAAMLNDPLVELVYIATPHSHHAEQIRQCVAAGKPVLCEKSFTANAKQAEEVLQEAETVKKEKVKGISKVL